MAKDKFQYDLLADIISKLPIKLNGAKDNDEKAVYLIDISNLLLENCQNVNSFYYDGCMLAAKLYQSAAFISSKSLQPHDLKNKVKEIENSFKFLVNGNTSPSQVVVNKNHKEDLKAIREQIEAKLTEELTWKQI